MFKLLAVTDPASCREAFADRLRRLSASDIDALILRAKELPPQDYLTLAAQAQLICQANGLPLILHTRLPVCGQLQPACKLPAACAAAAAAYAAATSRRFGTHTCRSQAGRRPGRRLSDCGAYLCHSLQTGPARARHRLFKGGLRCHTAASLCHRRHHACQYQPHQKSRCRRRLPDEQPDDLSRTGTAGTRTAAGIGRRTSRFLLSFLFECSFLLAAKTALDFLEKKVGKDSFSRISLFSF